ncbi:MAG: hypothetical protein R3E69_03705 [Steroidobacteraceae bacterium]
MGFAGAAAAPEISAARRSGSTLAGISNVSVDWQQFLSANASAVFALLGTVAGAILSFVASLVLKQREFNLQVRAKLLERQIAAHETILTLATEMRAMYAPGGVDAYGEVRRGPRILLSPQEFEAWFTRFSELQMQGTSWLSLTAKREVAFVQDYLVTLHTHLTEVPDENCFALGEAIRDDFIDLSDSLEERAFQFFQRGIGRAKPDSLDLWHKYDRKAAEDRLRGMKLLTAVELFKHKPERDAG